MPPRLSAQRVLSLTSSRATSRRHINSIRSLVTCTSARPPLPGKGRSYLLSKAGPSRAFHASSILLAPKDPYQVLGVKKDASPPEIKKTYFALARKYHPDTNPDKNAQEKFIEIQHAYDILKDEKKRAEYDKYGAASQQPGFDANAYENARSAFHQDGYPDLGALFGSGRNRKGSGNVLTDLFEAAFSSTTGDARQQFARGGNIETTIRISFMEACRGTSHTVNITPVVQCDTCSGTGLQAGVRRSTCPGCNGAGFQTFVVQSGFHMQSTCPTCGGAGSVVPPKGQCGPCHGQGHVRIRRSVKVDIPAGEEGTSFWGASISDHNYTILCPSGVEDGVAIGVSGQGDAALSAGGRPGDLFVRVNIAPSTIFKRQGANVFHEARIPVHTALLGGRVRVPTLDGEVDVRVPAGTQPGEQMVLKGHGITPAFKPRKGDLFITFNLQIPRSLTSRQRELLQQYADDVDGKTATASRQDTRQESSQTTSTDEGTSSGSRASSEAKIETETHVNDSFTEPPENGAPPADKHTKRDQDRKKRATA